MSVDAGRAAHPRAALGGARALPRTRARGRVGPPGHGLQKGAGRRRDASASGITCFSFCGPGPRRPGPARARRGARPLSARVSGPPGPAAAPALPGHLSRFPRRRPRKCAQTAFCTFAPLERESEEPSEKTRKEKPLFMAGELESGTIWWDLSGPGRPQPPGPPTSGKQCPADNVAGPAHGLGTPQGLLS